LPQSADFQKDFPATVREVVLSGFVGRMGFRPFYNRGEKEKANKLIEQLGIGGYANKSYKDLSGGQQQRVLLARALCATDELLIMDEPTNGLDARAIKQFYELVRKLNVDNGITIIMVSHNIEKVVKYASHIVYLKDSLQFAGSKEEFLTTEHAKYFKLGE
jgi:zinc transport system ATP-binding protein